ncbi:hypothetical protein [Nonomuraea cavernae]|uniref:hypothetical protein n=1 Tax=Nonomuraea cavernae TaxID=2045107 RepID=UPI0033C0E55A
MLQVDLASERLKRRLVSPLWMAAAAAIAAAAATLGSAFVGGLTAIVVGACAVGIMAGYSTSGSV